MFPILDLEELSQRRRWAARRRLMNLRFLTTPTSFLARMQGSEAWTDPLTFTGALTLNGGMVLGAGQTITLPGGSSFSDSAVVIAPSATTLSLTAALHANRRVNIASTGGLAVTPPAATGTGNVYTLFLSASITGGNFTIDAKAGQASDVFNGIAFQNKLGTGITTTPSAATSNLLTFDGSTKGGIAGDVITMIDAALHSWNLLINGQYTGTFASPFSNH